MNRNVLILVVLLCMLVLSLIYARQRAPQQHSTAPSARMVAAPLTTETLTPLQNPRGTITGYRPLAYPEAAVAEVFVKRDLFKPLFQPEMPQVARKATPVVLPPPPPPPTPRELAQKELHRYKFLGLMKKQDRLVVFFSNNGLIKLVRVGDTLVNGYRIINCTEERLLMRSEEGDELVLALR